MTSYLRKNFRLSKDLNQSLKEKAEEEMTSESTIIRKSIKQYCETEEE